MIITPLLYQSTVHIATPYIVERGGPYFEDEPLQSAPVEQTEKLRRAIRAAIDRGNPAISRAEVKALRDGKNPPMLSATGARSWYQLDRQMKGSWSLIEKSGRYEIRVDQPMEPRGWHEDKAKRVEFPPGTPVDEVIERLIGMIQERARQ
jgi:hypothetical protein